MIISTNKYQVLQEQCPKVDMKVSCSTVDDCIDYYRQQGAPDSWIQNQQFFCENNECMIIQNVCSGVSEFVEVDNQ